MGLSYLDVEHIKVITRDNSNLEVVTFVDDSDVEISETFEKISVTLPIVFDSPDCLRSKILSQTKLWIGLLIETDNISMSYSLHADVERVDFKFGRFWVSLSEERMIDNANSV